MSSSRTRELERLAAESEGLYDDYDEDFYDTSDDEDWGTVFGEEPDLDDDCEGPPPDLDYRIVVKDGVYTPKHVTPAGSPGSPETPQSPEPTECVHKGLDPHSGLPLFDHALHKDGMIYKLWYPSEVTHLDYVRRLLEMFSSAMHQLVELVRHDIKAAADEKRKKYLDQLQATNAKRLEMGLHPIVATQKSSVAGLGDSLEVVKIIREHHGLLRAPGMPELPEATVTTMKYSLEVISGARFNLAHEGKTSTDITPVMVRRYFNAVLFVLNIFLPVEPQPGANSADAAAGGGGGDSSAAGALDRDKARDDKARANVKHGLGIVQGHLTQMMAHQASRNLRIKQHLEECPACRAETSQASMAVKCHPLWDQHRQELEASWAETFAHMPSVPTAKPFQPKGKFYGKKWGNKQTKVPPKKANQAAKAEPKPASTEKAAGGGSRFATPQDAAAYLEQHVGPDLREMLRAHGPVSTTLDRMCRDFERLMLRECNHRAWRTVVMQYATDGKFVAFSSIPGVHLEVTARKLHVCQSTVRLSFDPTTAVAETPPEDPRLIAKALSGYAALPPAASVEGACGGSDDGDESDPDAVDDSAAVGGGAAIDRIESAEDHDVRVGLSYMLYALRNKSKSSDAQSPAYLDSPSVQEDDVPTPPPPSM